MGWNSRGGLWSPTSHIALDDLVGLATSLSPPDFSELVPTNPKDGDVFSIDLPLDRAVGGYVGMVAALGSLAAILLALRVEPRFGAHE